MLVVFPVRCAICVYGEFAVWFFWVGLIVFKFRFLLCLDLGGRLWLLLLDFNVGYIELCLVSDGLFVV